MKKYHVWKGNVKIEVDPPVKVVQNITNIEKFDTCVHRSEAMRKLTLRTCCTSVERDGFVCEKRKINFLTPSICSTCTVYEAKKT